MDPHLVEYHVARLASGATPLKAGGRRYYIRRPSPEAVMISLEIREEAEIQACRGGLMTREDALEILIESKGMWDASWDDVIDKIRTVHIKEAQVQLYESRADHEAIQTHRQVLSQARAELHRLESLRATLDANTVEGFVESAVRRFLVGCSIHLADGTPYWRDPDVDKDRSDDAVVEAALEKLATTQLGMTEIRELARDSRWRVAWTIRDKAEGIIPHPSCHLSDELIALIQWSSFYENAGNCDEPPEDSVIEDDDMFDGWLQVRARKMEQEAEKRKTGGKNYGEDGRIVRGREYYKRKIDGADEVFLMAERSPEDYRLVAGGVDRAITDADRNSGSLGVALRNRRLAYLSSEEARELASCAGTGSIPEALMPDVRERYGFDVETVKAVWKEEARLGLRKKSSDG